MTVEAGTQEAESTGGTQQTTAGAQTTTTDNSQEEQGQWDEKTAAYIKKLRAENASFRTKASSLETKVAELQGSLGKLQVGMKKALGLGDEGDDTPPEQKLEALTQHSETLAVQNAVLGIALENGIPASQLEYFQYLMGKKLASLADDEEMTEEDVDALVAEAKSKGAPGVTTTGAGGSGNAPQPGSKNAVSLEQFVKMTVSEKSQLYGQQPEMYKALMAEAVQKRLL
jgi:galactokinase